MNFGSPNWLWSLWLLAPLVTLLVWSWRVKQRLLTRFISVRLLETLTSGVSKARQKIRLVLFAVAVGALLFSLSRPQLGFSLEEAKQRGLDIVVAIDTSKSMLADDVQPNRLERAKRAAFDLMKLAKSDRLGLVAGSLGCTARDRGEGDQRDGEKTVMSLHRYLHTQQTSGRVRHRAQPLGIVPNFRIS